jgi:UDP-2,4-diacetamido-2,4,6-trideoxy-beta-L-altropyranose hydrolase
MKPRLVVRADATAEIGTGHLQRCLTLATAWRNLGGLVTFCGRCESPGLARLVQSEADVVVEPPAVHPDPADLDCLLDVLSAPAPERSVVVLDGYQFNRAFQSAVRHVRPLLAIDDLGLERNPDVDLMLNQNIHAPDLAYCRQSSTRYLLGLSYALLRTEFQAYAAWQRVHPSRARRLLVTMGGSDIDGATLRVLDALSSVEDLEVRVIVGGINPHLNAILERAGQRPHISVVRETDQMALEMASADVAISASGGTSWELAFMGLPSLLIALADNQEPLARGLDAAGAAIDLGRAEALDLEVLRHELLDLRDEGPRRKTMSERGRQLLDGRGAERVAAALWDLCA